MNAFVNDGWLPLVAEAQEKLGALDVEILEIKEKHGALRIAMGMLPSDNTVAAKAESVVSDLENRSQTICEFCGRPGTHARWASFSKTLCESCEAKGKKG